jgi:hypothetical protein
MTDTEYKIRENRVRRMAERQGLRLVKSRRRDPRALDYGGYMIVDPSTNAIVYSYGYNEFGASLDDAEAWLMQDPS